MINQQTMRWVGCLLAVALVLAGFAAPAEAKKKSTADKMKEQLQKEIKQYEVKLKAAQERMKLANKQGEEVEPKIKPAEEQMRKWKQEMEDQQRKRAQASREMQEKLKEDETIKAVRVEEEQAEDQRDAVMAKLMPDIKAKDEYKDLAAKRDASAAYLEKVKREEREDDIPFAATALARDQGALGTYVQDQLIKVEAYKTVEDALDEAQAKRRATEKEVTAKYREEAKLDLMDDVYEEKRGAYQESREELRDLERQFKQIRSDYKDAEKDADWAARRIDLHKKRIKALSR